MLTHIRINNFKRLQQVEFELGKSVVLIGPNNSGKTTALQALALWDIGYKQWQAKRGGKKSPSKRPGVTINRKDLVSIPVPVANLLWHEIHVRNIQRIKTQRTQNVLIDIIVEGIIEDKCWTCGFEFDYANEESFYCRPLRLGSGNEPERMPVPEEASDVKIVFLPPMSGLSEKEFIKQPGEIDWLVGQGQTAQVLRNLCYRIFLDSPQSWKELVEYMKDLFGIKLLEPQYIKERAEITLAYQEKKATFDLSSSGRGLQQTLLLLTYLYANPKTVLLLDEPDAHLEILRQRQTYHLINEIAERYGSQIIAASHSEVILNEAAERHTVISFVGKPRRMNERKSQVLKALSEIGYEHYYQAEETGWVLYLEGSTDLAILKVLAQRLNHEAIECLARPFVHYVFNQPNEVRKHFWGLQYAKPDLVGIALFDHLDREPPTDLGVQVLQWRKRELENYICSEEVLLEFARYKQPDDIFGSAEADHRVEIMKESIHEYETAFKTVKNVDLWSPDVKATDDVLDRLLDIYFQKLGLPNLLRKGDYHILAHLIAVEKLDPEIIEKLDAIVNVAKQAKGRED